MKKLYYTVEKQLQDIDGFEEATGWKTITTFSVVNGEIEKQFEIECGKSKDSEEEINDYLAENGMGDTKFELVIL